MKLTSRATLIGTVITAAVLAPAVAFAAFSVGTSNPGNGIAAGVLAAPGDLTATAHPVDSAANSGAVTLTWSDIALRVGHGGPSRLLVERRPASSADWQPVATPPRRRVRRRGNVRLHRRERRVQRDLQLPGTVHSGQLDGRPVQRPAGRLGRAHRSGRARGHSRPDSPPLPGPAAGSSPWARAGASWSASKPAPAAPPGSRRHPPPSTTSTALCRAVAEHPRLGGRSRRAPSSRARAPALPSRRPGPRSPRARPPTCTASSPCPTTSPWSARTAPCATP